MTGNTSATGGYLTPLPSLVAPPEDIDLDIILQAMIVGVTGLDGTLVRPRWQPTDPKQPERTVNWCAIGVTSVTPDDNAAIIHQSNAVPTTDQFGRPYTVQVGLDQMQRHETLQIMATFYGPNANGYAAMLRNGLAIAQNREALFFAGMAFVSVGPITKTGELTNQGFIRRSDVTLTVRRIVALNYPVLNIASAQGSIVPDDGASTPFNVETNL